ncbi:chromatin remodeling protein SHL [Raphanus sativus]|uniref:Chromatin remodeling protein SHL n=1 Tax=Raphanus sativus TaxID=3726 RepID=A0A6J0LUX7_RAPSA|nr:chromatin remodeling protein SHL [Raphanus sativus]
MPKQKGAQKKQQLKSYKLKHINRTIQEGDAVLMRSSEPGKPSYVARVEAIETTDARGSNARVRVRWYYRPEESMGGRRQFHGAKEVFLSDHYDLQSADTIEGKCKVHSFGGYTKLGSVGNDDFFCRFEYNSATGAFNPDRVAVFCKCEMPYNPDDLMVQCEDCSEWFHPSCIGTTIEAAKKLEHFYCEECSPEPQDLDNSISTSKNTDAKVNTKRNLEVSKTRNKHAKRSG